MRMPYNVAIAVDYIRAIGKPLDFDEEAFLKALGNLTEAAYSNKEAKIRELVQQTVVTYHPAENA